MKVGKEEIARLKAILDEMKDMPEMDMPLNYNCGGGCSSGCYVSCITSCQDGCYAGCRGSCHQSCYMTCRYACQDGGQQQSHW